MFEIPVTYLAIIGLREKEIFKNCHKSVEINALKLWRVGIVV